MSQTQVKIQPENHLMVALLGQRDEFLRLIEQHFDARPFVRGNEITIEGPEAAQVGTLLNELLVLIEYEICAKFATRFRFALAVKE